MIFRMHNVRTGKEYPCTIELDDRYGVPAKGQIVVYGLIDPRDNAMYYVGQTNQFKARMGEHCTAPVLHSDLWRRKGNIYHAGCHSRVVILHRCADRSESDYWENYYLRNDRDRLLANNQRRVRGG